MKANSIIGTEVLSAGVIRFHVKGAGFVDFDTTKVHVDVAVRAAQHGFIQRISDAAAISRDPETGRPATAEEKMAKMAALIAHYETGTAEWSRVQAGGPKGGLLFDALCRLYGHQKAPSDIRTWLDGLSDKEQAALREDATIAPVIAAIKAERAKDQPKMDTASLLADLTK